MIIIDFVKNYKDLDLIPWININWEKVNNDVVRDDETYDNILDLTICFIFWGIIIKIEKRHA